MIELINLEKQRVRIGKYKPVFKGEIFTVLAAKAVFPNGRKATFERITRVDSVAVLAIDKKKRLLLTWEYRPVERKYEWRLPAGRVDKEKSPKKAAQRELMEEAGVKAKRLKLFYKRKPNQSSNYSVFIYLASGLSLCKVEVDEAEDITVIPTPISKAYKMVVNGEIENETVAYSIARLYWERKKWLK